MITINNIYSPSGLFDKVVFRRNGINIIVGKYSGDKETTGINGIGKSTLIRMIDYALLSEKASKIFQEEKYDFLKTEEHLIVLEFEIDNEKYEIRRTFKKSDAVLFGKLGSELASYDVNELKIVLANKFFPLTDPNVYLEATHFRSIMNFFIKDDLEHHQRINPLNFLYPTASKGEIYLFNLFLLNLKNKNLANLNEVSKESDKIRKIQSSLKINLEKETGKTIEEFQSERLSKEESIKQLENNLKKYEFLDEYKNVEEQLVGITNEINIKLGQYHGIDKRLRNIQLSYNSPIDFDTSKIKDFYNELIPTLGDLLKKSLDETLDFRKNIITNRVKFLVEQEDNLKKQVDEILKDISSLEQKRSILFGFLNEKGALDSIKNAYENLIIEKTSLSRPIQVLDQLDDYTRKLASLNVEVSKLKKDTLDDLEQEKEKVRDIKLLFIDILRHALAIQEGVEKSYLEIEPQAKGLPLKIDVEVAKAEALGKSRLKILAYDLLAFLFNIQNDRNFPRFLVHDGVFHAIETRAKINTLNYIYHKNLEFPDFQYIITVNEDEIALSEEDKKIHGDYDFKWEDFIVAEYTDRPEKMFLRRDIDNQAVPAKDL